MSTASTTPSTMQAIIFVGIQASGKTSFYRQHFFDTHVRINLDMLRTRRREQLIFNACLAAQQPFVIDNTNPLPPDRARYIAPARDAGFRLLAYFFETSLQDAFRRNNQRAAKQKIPVPAIAATLRKLQPPTPEEGFDEIHKVTISSEGAFIVAKQFPS